MSKLLSAIVALLFLVTAPATAATYHAVFSGDGISVDATVETSQPSDAVFRWNPANIQSAVFEVSLSGGTSVSFTDVFDTGAVDKGYVDFSITDDVLELFPDRNTRMFVDLTTGSDVFRFGALNGVLGMRDVSTGQNYYLDGTYTLSQVPLPAPILLLIGALGGLIGIGKFRNRAV